MAPAYRGGRTPRHTWPRRVRGGMLLGIIIGFALGLAVAAAIAYLLTKTSNPFDGKSVKPNVTIPNLPGAERVPEKQGDRPRFDFSKILPGTDERKTPKDETAAGQVSDKPVTASKDAEPADAKGGKYFLQAGAYQNSADAEDQRAKLALMGIEASIQTVSVPEKGNLNRVRLGPYRTAEEMNQVKAELLKRGVVTAVIRNP